MNNKKAEIHKDAEEKRAMVEAKRGEEFVQIEETAAKHRSTGTTPKMLFGCCGFWFLQAKTKLRKQWKFGSFVFCC